MTCPPTGDYVGIPGPQQVVLFWKVVESLVGGTLVEEVGHRGWGVVCVCVGGGGLEVLWPGSIFCPLLPDYWYDVISCLT